MNVDDQSRSVPAAKIKPPWARGELWFVFVALFVGTPVLCIMSLSAESSGGPFLWIILACGTLGAGFTLSRLFTKRDWTFLALGVVFSIVVFTIYAATAYALLMAMFSHMRC